MTDEAVHIPPLPSDRPRPLWPQAAGHADRDGLRIWWEAFGSPGRTIYLLPPWGLMHSRVWDHHVATLARHARVLVSDPPGNGRSGPARDTARHTQEALAADCLAVMDAARVERAVLVGHSRGAQWLLQLAAEHPHRVDAAVFIAPFLPVTPSLFPWLLTHPRLARGFHGPDLLPIWWGRMNARAWRRDMPRFARWFTRRAMSTPHSEGPVEDGVEYALDADVETLIAGMSAPVLRGRRAVGALADRVQCPVTVIHGDADRVTPRGDAVWLAERTRGRLVDLAGADHVPQVRQSVAVIDEILTAAGVSRTVARRPHAGRRRALFLSSPIGLGHARRDLAIARELRTQSGGLDVVWLTQQPSTRLLADAGETIHPASRELANECSVIEQEASGARLNAFRALRRADAILSANYQVFRELVRAESFDLVIGDEAWEIDHFLHENPADKPAPYVWLTDFVGLLPTEADGERERELIADRNALMLEQRERHPGVRDLSLFVGDPADCVGEPFGPGLASIAEWTAAQFEFTGYVCSDEAGDRERVRARMGWRPHERVCVAAVGGSAVGAWLLGRVIEAAGELSARVPGLRLVAVAGPRVDQARLPSAPGVEILGYVPDLPQVLAAADVAVVQGGLATAMELTAARVPFVYVPLEAHFEQQIHVTHRLARHRAGRRLRAADATPSGLALAVADALAAPVDVIPVPHDGARRAAQRILEVM